MSFKENEYTSPATVASSPQAARAEYAEVTKEVSVPYQDHDVTPTAEERPQGHWIYIAVFLVCGAAELWYWNALLNMIFDMTAAHFPNYPNISDTMTAFYGTTNFVVVVILSWRGSLNFVINVAAGVVLTAVQILTPICAIYPGEKTAVYLLHVLAALAGCGTGCYQGGHYALAAALPGKGYTAWVSTGNGISGVVTFCLWMIFSQAAFPENIDMSLWITSIIGAVLLVAATVSVVYLYRRPDVHGRIGEQRERARLERKDPNRLRYFDAFKLCWKSLMCILFIFWVSLLLFPNIGPLRWNTSLENPSSQTNTVMGMFQVGDLVGRFTPTLASKLPWVMLSINGLIWATFSRFLFFVFFILFWKVKNAAFSNVGFQVVIMLLFAVTNGWFSTVGLVRAPEAIVDVTYKGRGGALGVAALLLGLALGLWTAKLATLGS